MISISRYTRVKLYGSRFFFGIHLMANFSLVTRCSANLHTEKLPCPIVRSKSYEPTRGDDDADDEDVADDNEHDVTAFGINAPLPSALLFIIFTHTRLKSSHFNFRQLFNSSTFTSFFFCFTLLVGFKYFCWTF